MSADTIYARVIAGHPVVAFATWDWGWHPRRDYLSFDRAVDPWIGPYYASHVYTVVGVSPGSVLINDRSAASTDQQGVTFQAGYSDFQRSHRFRLSERTLVAPTTLPSTSRGAEGWWSARPRVFA